MAIVTVFAITLILLVVILVATDDDHKTPS